MDKNSMDKLITNKEGVLRPMRMLCQKQYLKKDEIIECHRRATYKQYNTFQGVWIYRCGLHKYRKSLWAKIKQEYKNG